MYTTSWQQLWNAAGKGGQGGGLVLLAACVLRSTPSILLRQRIIRRGKGHATLLAAQHLLAPGEENGDATPAGGARAEPTNCIPFYWPFRLSAAWQASFVPAAAAAFSRQCPFNCGGRGMCDHSHGICTCSAIGDVQWAGLYCQAQAARLGSNATLNGSVVREGVSDTPSLHPSI